MDTGGVYKIVILNIKIPLPHTYFQQQGKDQFSPLQLANLQSHQQRRKHTKLHIQTIEQIILGGQRKLCLVDFYYAHHEIDADLLAVDRKSHHKRLPSRETSSISNRPRLVSRREVSLWH